MKVKLQDVLEAINFSILERNIIKVQKHRKYL